MATQELQHEKKIQAQLDKWNAKLEELKAKAAQKDAEARLAHQKKIEELQKERDEFEAKVKDLRKSSEAASEEMAQGLQKAWNELGSSLEKAFSKFE